MLKEENDRAAVSRAHCSCKGGSSGHCNHVLALMYQLNDYSWLDLDVKDIPSDVSCTSRPQSWHIPRATSICPLPVMGTYYLLSDQEPCLLMNTVFGNVPLGSCLAYQLQDHGRPNTRFASNRLRDNLVTDNAAMQCSEFIDLPVVIDDKTSFDLTELNMLNQLDLTAFFIDHIVIDKSDRIS